MNLRALLPLALLAGCASVPQPSRYAATPPIAGIEQATGGVSLSCCFWPVIGADFAVPVKDSPLAVDLQIQGNGPGGSISPGLWYTFEGTGDEENFAAARFGLIGGTGDMLGLRPWGMPYGGASVQGQLARRTASGRSFALTGGFEGMAPVGWSPGALGDTTLEWDNENGSGEFVPLFGGYFTADAFVGLPVGDYGTIGLGAGLDLMIYGLPLPQVSLTARL